MVTTPSLKKYRPSVVNNHNGTVSVNYNPTEPGAHTLEMSYAGVPLQDSPYKFSVQPVKPGLVSAHGPGLSSGMAGQPTSFTVVTKDAGPGHTDDVCLSVCLSKDAGPGHIDAGCLSVCMPVCLSVCLSVCPRTPDQVTLMLAVCLCVCLSQSVCLSVCPSVHLCDVCLCVCLSVSLSVRLSICVMFVGVCNRTRRMSVVV